MLAAIAPFWVADGLVAATATPGTANLDPVWVTPTVTGSRPGRRFAALHLSDRLLI